MSSKRVTSRTDPDTPAPRSTAEIIPASDIRELERRNIVAALDECA
jgi:hypothetical protein